MERTDDPVFELAPTPDDPPDAGGARRVDLAEQGGYVVVAPVGEVLDALAVALVDRLVRYARGGFFDADGAGGEEEVPRGDGERLDVSGGPVDRGPVAEHLLERLARKLLGLRVRVLDSAGMCVSRVEYREGQLEREPCGAFYTVRVLHG